MNVKLAYCWAHVRREFFKIQSNYPEECRAILDTIDHLFAIEKKARDWEELKRLRENESKPLVSALYHQMIEVKKTFLSQSAISKAATYALKLWPGLQQFLKDPKVPLSNNLSSPLYNAERAVRHVVMGRKNFYGSQSINGADVAATLYTVIESCKKVEPRVTATIDARRSSPHKLIDSPLLRSWHQKSVLHSIKLPNLYSR